jgi:DnaJ-class molecular chaperone
MGFDLSGMNPNMISPEPELPPFPERTDKDWEKYHDWQEENSGVYFRNNVWWWRPLWNFVTKISNDILTEKDIESGSYNDGHKISKTKAVKIAKRLYKLIETDQVKAYESMYKKQIESLEQVDCDICDATGKRQEPPKTGAGDRECNGCNGTGKVDDWDKSYPFSEDNVREFANFCFNSGGFQIW